MNLVRKPFSITKKISAFFLISCIILFVSIIVISEIFLKGDMRNTFEKYYYVSIFLLLFFSIVYFLREELQAKLIMISISLVIGLYAVELFLNFSQKSLDHNIANSLNVTFDKRTKLETINDFRDQGVNAVPLVTPSDLLDFDENFLPLGGISNKTTVGINETGTRMIYLSDRYGFNNPDSEWNHEEIEWLLTGDSFAEGVAVNPGEDIASQIRLITKNSVLNLGRSSNGPLMELAVLLEYGEKIKPKKVLWLYYEGNDLKSDFYRDNQNYLLMHYLEDDFSQNLIKRQEEIDKRLEIFVEKAIEREKNLNLLNKTSWIRLVKIRTLFRNFSVQQYEINPKNQLFIEILSKAKNTVEEWGGEIYFVYLPMHQRYKEKSISHNDYMKKDEVINLVQSLGIKLIDIHKEVFANDKDPFDLFSLRIARHYNSRGYARVARSIVSIVNQSQ